MEDNWFVTYGYKSDKATGAAIEVNGNSDAD